MNIYKLVGLNKMDFWALRELINEFFSKVLIVVGKLWSIIES